MKKPLLLEVTAPEARILDEQIDEKTGERVTRVEVKWQHAGIINGNGRRYRDELLQREVDKLRPLMEKGMVFGATYHPKGEAEVDDISHIWESVEKRPDGSWMGVVKVLPTDRGKNAQAIIRHGGRIGMSSRGYGTVTSKEETVGGKTVKVDEVNDDFALKSFGDFVLTPSVPDAGTQNILEARFQKEEDASQLNEENKMFKTIDELRAAQPELLKPLDEELTGLKDQNKTLSDAVAALEAKAQEQEKLVEDLGKLVEGYVFSVREAISSMSELPGVIPEEEEPVADAQATAEAKAKEEAEAKAKEESEAKAKAEADAKSKEEADAKVKAEAEAKTKEEAELKAKTDAEAKVKAEAEAKATADKAAQEAQVNQENILKAIKEALGKETPEYQKLIEVELIKEGKPLVETLDAVTPKVTEIREKLSAAKAAEEKEKIVKTGIDEKGRVANPEKTAVPLTEEQVKVRWQMARAAGYKGSLEQYSKDVLHLNG